MVRIGEISVEITATTSKLRANLAQASSLIRDFSLLSQGLTGGITNAFRQISDVAVRALQISLVALGGSFALAAKTGANFEDEIIRAFTILKEGGNAMASSLSRMTSTALELGRETLFSAIQAAEGMQVLARAGFNTKEILDSIRPTLDLAIVGNLGLAESADIVIAALRGFNLETKDAGKVADILALGSSKANTTIQELGNALSYVAPVAAGAGLTIEETSAAIGILSNAGIRGSRAGTTLRRALSQMLAPSRKAKEVMDELGVSFVDANGKLKPFTMIIRELEKAGMTASQAMQMFGLRAGPGMIALVNAGSGSINKLSTSLERAKGTADDMSQAFRTTVKGRVRDLMASIVDLGLAFSEKFKKPVADAIFTVRNFVVDIVNIGNRMGIFKSIVDGVKDALEPVSDLIGELGKKFKKWLSELTPGEVAKFFGTLKEHISAFVESLTEGELGAIIKDTFMVIISLGKTLINTIKAISAAWMLLPEGLRDAIRPLTIVTLLVIKLFGGIMNIVFLMVSLNALWASLGLKVTFTATAMASLKAVLLVAAKLCAGIALVLVGWTVGRFIGELAIVKSYFTALAIIAGNIGPSLKLIAMSLLAVQQPWRLLNKEFKAEMKATMEKVKISAMAIKELDWIGAKEKKNDLEKIKDSFSSIGEFVASLFSDKKMKIEIEKPKVPYMEVEGEQYDVVGGKVTKKESPYQKYRKEAREKDIEFREKYRSSMEESIAKSREESKKKYQEALEKSRKGKPSGEAADYLKSLGISVEELSNAVEGSNKGVEIYGILNSLIGLVQQVTNRLNISDARLLNVLGVIGGLQRQAIKPDRDYMTKSDLGASLK